MNRKHIGQNIRILRRQCNMTQAQLAEQLNVSADHISHVEIGTCSISTARLIEICRILNVTPNDVLAGEYEPEAYSDNEPCEKVLPLKDISPYNRTMLEYIFEYMVEQNNRAGGR